MKAWVFQDPKQKTKHGEKKCPWSVGWYDERGRKKSKSVGPKSTAKAYARKLEGESAAGLLKSRERLKWAEFVTRFEEGHLDTLAARSREEYKTSLGQFNRICRPGYVEQVDAAMVDEFRAKRLKEGVGPATVNKDLRHLKVAMNKARKWRLIGERVEFEMLREPERDPEYVDDDAFAKLYNACDQMTLPAGKHYPAPDWWRALLVFAYLTGWRIGQIMALRRDDVDFGAGTAFVEADKTKGKRDARVDLPKPVVDHLKGIAGFDDLLFAWPHHTRTLYAHFANLKKAAKVEYSGAFHRFRFGFCNANVDALPADVLQQLMQHQDAKTTKLYVNRAARLRRQGTADLIHVPEILTKKA
ncbi:site-specific tyrosine recombinase XerD [Posidoniimonas polymericola]|uniref:Site-specific tyrosine recombinase XerD n=1 Tax=Posidoniimonas polymericola TaxID=2528002 RepID=A0A5C5YKT0_9BACT|nr:tyrosine-type recombinase/integrase [Posidoniimonas polymericola]TWT75520.1 site-specific tyrosine recombinase XerD [Posidoniimonas polymericola]